MLQEIRLKVKSGSLNANIDLQLQNFISLPTDKRNHETFANTLMHPKSFTSRHTSHGIKYESEAIHAYVKQMHSRSMPVQAFRSDLVVYKKKTSPGLLSRWKSHQHRLHKTILFA